MNEKLNLKTALNEICKNIEYYIDNCDELKIENDDDLRNYIIDCADVVILDNEIEYN